MTTWIFRVPYGRNAEAARAGRDQLRVLGYSPTRVHKLHESAGKLEAWHAVDVAFSAEEWATEAKKSTERLGLLGVVVNDPRSEGPRDSWARLGKEQGSEDARI